MKHAVFLLGAPGVGKTELTRGLLGTGAYVDGRWTVGKRFIAAGPYTGNVFDGPDALPTSVHVVRAMIHETVSKSLPGLFDGERFCAWTVKELKAQTVCVALFLEAPIEVLRERRAKRGSPPVLDNWLIAKEKSARIVASVCSRVKTIDANQKPQRVLADAYRALYREGVL